MELVGEGVGGSLGGVGRDSGGTRGGLRGGDPADLGVGGVTTYLITTSKLPLFFYQLLLL